MRTDTEDIAEDLNPSNYDAQHSEAWNDAVEKKALELENEMDAMNQQLPEDMIGAIKVKDVNFIGATAARCNHHHHIVEFVDEEASLETMSATALAANLQAAATTAKPGDDKAAAVAKNIQKLLYRLDITPDTVSNGEHFNKI